jgi:hypothetical protein
VEEDGRFRTDNPIGFRHQADFNAQCNLWTFTHSAPFGLKASAAISTIRSTMVTFTPDNVSDSAWLRLPLDGFSSANMGYYPDGTTELNRRVDVSPKCRYYLPTEAEQSSEDPVCLRLPGQPLSLPRPVPRVVPTRLRFKGGPSLCQRRRRRASRSYLPSPQSPAHDVHA